MHLYQDTNKEWKTTIRKQSNLESRIPKTLKKILNSGHKSLGEERRGTRAAVLGEKQRARLVIVELTWSVVGQNE